MHRLLVTTLLALGTLTTLSQEVPAQSRHPNIPDRLDFAFPTLEGDTVRLSDERYRGKVVLVDIFGTWCGPCRRQAPALSEWHKKYGEQGFEIIGIAFEHPRNQNPIATLEKYAEQYDLNYQILVGGTIYQVKRKIPELADLLGLFPTTILVDREGAIEGIEFGYEEFMKKDQEGSIEHLLKAPVPGEEEESSD